MDHIFESSKIFVDEEESGKKNMLQIIEKNEKLMDETKEIFEDLKSRINKFVINETDNHLQ